MSVSITMPVTVKRGDIFFHIRCKIYLSIKISKKSEYKYFLVNDKTFHDFLFTKYFYAKKSLSFPPPYDKIKWPLLRRAIQRRNVVDSRGLFSFEEHSYVH